MTASSLFSVLFQLPLAIVLIIGLVQLGRRKADLGPRRTMFARIGAVLLLIGAIVQAAWTLTLPIIFSSLDRPSVSSLGVLSALVGVIMTVLQTVGVALLIVAVVSRESPSAPGFPAPAGYPTPPAGYPAQPGYPTQPGYPVQPGYPAQPDYTAQPGYPTQPGHPGQQYGPPA